MWSVSFIVGEGKCMAHTSKLTYKYVDQREQDVMYMIQESCIYTSYWGKWEKDCVSFWKMLRNRYFLEDSKAIYK